jgi:penicillin G amidase
MKISSTPQKYTYNNSSVYLSRGERGILSIKAECQESMAYGLGLGHASDRFIQMNLQRFVAQGRLCEFIHDSDEAFDIDLFMREVGIYHESKKEVSLLEGHVYSYLKAYTDGVNYVLKRSRPWEFRLLKVDPPEWTMADSLSIAKLISYVGLAQTQQDLEKFLVESVKNEMSFECLKDIFSPFLSNITSEQMELAKKVNLYRPQVPQQIYGISGLKNSNNWVVSGKKSKSGLPMAAYDPHLEINRLPALWYEVKAHLPDSEYICGINVPGVPGWIMGRNRHLSFGFSYGFMDTVDYFFEDVSNNKFRNGDHWLHFNQRKEIIKRPKGKDFEFILYENDRGVLERHPEKDDISDGIYLSRAWTGHSQGGGEAIDILMKFPFIKDVEEAQNAVKNLFLSGNWLFADKQGNIGYQQSGKLPNRNSTQLFPTEGWNSENQWNGIVSGDQLLRINNPEEGFLATANNNLNNPSGPTAITAAMAPYRLNRITKLLKSKEKIEIDEMKAIQSDLYSIQAELFLEKIKDQIPDTPSGRILSSWDFRYNKESLGATLFEAFYQNCLDAAFSEEFGGQERWEYIKKHSALMAVFYGHCDELLLSNQRPQWLSKTVDNDFFTRVLKKTLSEKPVGKIQKWGEKNKFVMKNILLGETIFGKLGLNKGPYPLEGSRATIVQANLYKQGQRDTSFGVSWRFITDLAEDVCYTTLPGGPSERPWSSALLSDFPLWNSYKYKTLMPNE